MARLFETYREEVFPQLQKEFGLTNRMQVPKVEKVTCNIGVGEASRNAKLLDTATEQLTVITGQKPQITRAKKSISNFKLREGMPIGCRVTLRGNRMWDFLDRLITTALPRLRDFRGGPNKSFDSRGNFTLGIRENLIFPEVDSHRVETSKGLNVTIVTTADNDEQAHFLLRELGMPFATS